MCDTHTVIMTMITQPWLTQMSVVQVKGQSMGCLWWSWGRRCPLKAARPHTKETHGWSICSGADSLPCRSCEAMGQSWRLREYLSRQSKTVGRVSIALLTPKRASKNVRGVEKRGGAGVWNDVSNLTQILREIAFSTQKVNKTFVNWRINFHTFFFLWF